MAQSIRIENIKNKSAKLVLFSELQPFEGLKYVQNKVTLNRFLVGSLEYNSQKNCPKQ